MTTASIPIETPETQIDSQRETSHELAADLIERNLQSRFFDLFITIIQIKDAGLLLPDGTGLLRGAEELCKEGEALEARVHKTFDACFNSKARSFMKRTCRTLLDEVDCYRQAQFWGKDDRDSLIRTEVLIRDLFDFYRAAENLMLNIDAGQPDYRMERRCRAPERPVNSYEEIVA